MEREGKISSLLKHIYSLNSASAALAVSNTVMTYQDLQPLTLNLDPPRHVMQVYLSYLSKGNKSLGRADKVKIYKIKTVQAILHMQAGTAHKQSTKLYE